ncbi:hypothetical protein [Kitasatospora purpeofusca]|uniref:hypothetical protein n=1 Tax=Kitasatospora purpeofusca TaxID=67352 RepID=UPI003817C193
MVGCVGETLGGGVVVPALVARTDAKVGNASEAGQAAWLDAFFDVRIDDLTNPANSVTAFGSTSIIR